MKTRRARSPRAPAPTLPAVAGGQPQAPQRRAFGARPGVCVRATTLGWTAAAQLYARPAPRFLPPSRNACGNRARHTGSTALRRSLRVAPRPLATAGGAAVAAAFVRTRTDLAARPRPSRPWVHGCFPFRSLIQASTKHTALHTRPTSGVAATGPFRRPPPLPGGFERRSGSSGHLKSRVATAAAPGGRPARRDGGRWAAGGQPGTGSVLYRAPGDTGFGAAAIGTVGSAAGGGARRRGSARRRAPCAPAARRPPWALRPTLQGATAPRTTPRRSTSCSSR